jgi:phage shock protein C
MAKRKLVRSANKVLAGVCGGIADYFDVDPTLIRVLYAVLSLFSAAFPGLLLYIILLLLIPEAGRNDHYEDAQVVE